MWQIEESHDPFYLEEGIEVGSDGRRDKITPLTLEEIIRIFNERLIKAQEE